MAEARSEAPDESEDMGLNAFSWRWKTSHREQTAKDYIEILQNKLLPTTRDLLGG